MTDTTTWIQAVRSSHDRFAGLVTPLSATEVEQPSYASEWSIADTASHLGSQAEIFGVFLDAGLAGEPVRPALALRPDGRCGRAWRPTRRSSPGSSS